MDNKIKIVALFGKSGSGKDTVKKLLLNQMNNTHNIISNTTRPQRDYEENGRDYFFIDVAEFTKKLLKGDILEATEFNNWFYGISKDSLDKNKINIGIFTPAGIDCLLENSNLNILPIYIQTNDKIRLIRQLNREENPNIAEIIRRYSADEKDFQDNNLDFDFYTFENNTDEKIDIQKLIYIIEHDNFNIGED